MRRRTLPHHCLGVGSGQCSALSRAPYQVALTRLFVISDPLLREAC